MSTTPPSTRTSSSESIVPPSYDGVTSLPSSEVDAVPISSHFTSASKSPLVSSEPSASYNSPLPTVVSSISLPVVSSISLPVVTLGSKSSVLAHHTTLSLSSLTKLPSTPSSIVSISDYEDSTTVLASPSTSIVSDSSRSPLSSLSKAHTLPEVFTFSSSSPTATGGSSLGIDPVLLLYIVIPPCCLLVLVVLAFGLVSVGCLVFIMVHCLPLVDRSVVQIVLISFQRCPVPSFIFCSCFLFPFYLQFLCIGRIMR